MREQSDSSSNPAGNRDAKDTAALDVGPIPRDLGATPGGSDPDADLPASNYEPTFFSTKPQINSS